MQVTFERTGERRYGVRIVVAGQAPRYTNPAPGFHAYIPHDLVHYLVEAELRMTAAVFGRAAQGGGAFVLTNEGVSARERSREQRRQRKREARLNRQDDESAGEMLRAERLALLCDITWRRRHGQHGDEKPWLAPAAPTAEEILLTERVVDRLEPLAERWHALPIGGALSFTWPGVEPNL
jgi:hypothetical protein